MPGIKIVSSLPAKTTVISDVDTITTRTASCKLQPTPVVTLKEGFLPDVKILKPVDGVLPPNPAEMLSRSPKRRIVVGISGVSCGGKTTVASALNKWLDNQGQLIMQDDYYLPPKDLPINTITNFPEFDEPESVKMHEIRDAIVAWLAVPMSDDEQTQVLIVEGTMIFTNPEICELCDLRYLVHVSFEVAEYRRSLREYPIPDPPLVVAKNVWPKYIKHRTMFCNLVQKYGFMSKQIDGTIPVDFTVAGILQDVKVNKHQ